MIGSRKPYGAALVLVLAALGCENRADPGRTSETRERPAEPRVDPRGVEPRVMPARPAPESAPTWESVTGAWPEKPRGAAQELAKKYGPPDEFTASKLIWHKRGPWKRTMVSREEVSHNWPAPHTDFVEQVIDMRVPPDMFDDLAKFDGSVIAERTKGEVSARCGGEAANFLALNLANDIVNGKRNVRDARTYYANAMKQKEDRTVMDPYLEKLVFEPPAGGTADPDKADETTKASGSKSSAGAESGAEPRNTAPPAGQPAAPNTPSQPPRPTDLP
jgi:hypothetical protein